MDEFDEDEYYDSLAEGYDEVIDYPEDWRLTDADS